MTPIPYEVQTTNFDSSYDFVMTMQVFIDMVVCLFRAEIYDFINAQSSRNVFRLNCLYIGVHGIFSFIRYSSPIISLHV